MGSHVVGIIIIKALENVCTPLHIVMFCKILINMSLSYVFDNFDLIC